MSQAPKLHPVPIYFEFDGHWWRSIETMQNYRTRCLATPVNVCGAPRWFTNDEIGVINDN